jgi:predicted kinase
VPTPLDTPVLILTGSPGVGKTTTAAILAARSPRAVHLESDAFFRFVAGGYVEPWKPESHAQNRAVFAAVAAAASAYASAGYLTVIDGIVIPGWFKEPLSEVIEAAGHRVAYAVLREPLATCVRRAGGREGGEELVDPGTIERVWHQFAELGELERHALDLGGRDPEHAADLIEEKLGEGVLAV